MAVIAIRKNNTYTSTELYQWDKHRLLEIYGLNFSKAPEIHFTNDKTSRAIVKQSTPGDDGSYKVLIPNSLLQEAKDITLYVCSHNGDEFISHYSMSIKVKARNKPEDYIAENDEKIYSYIALEYLVNNTIIALKEENARFHDEIIAEVKALNAQTKAELQDIVDNATIANADTVDGYNAEDFVFNAKPSTTIFNADGSITVNYRDGSRETTVFNPDGSITRTITTKDIGIKTETTIFNSDGSISIGVE